MKRKIKLRTLDALKLFRILLQTTGTLLYTTTASLFAHTVLREGRRRHSNLPIAGFHAFNFNMLTLYYVLITVFKDNAGNIFLRFVDTRNSKKTRCSLHVIEPTGSD
jgi:hypothetical protein